MSNDPDLFPVWETCETCHGEQIVRDDNDLDIDCPACDGDGGFER